MKRGPRVDAHTAGMLSDGASAVRGVIAAPLRVNLVETPNQLANSVNLCAGLCFFLQRGARAPRSQQRRQS